MKFKITVDELQNIFAKAVHVVRSNENDGTGMAAVEASDDGLVFKFTNGSVTMAIDAVNFEVTEKGKKFFLFREIKPYISKYFPLIDGYGTDGFVFEFEGDSGTLKTKTIYKDCKPVYKSLKFKVFSDILFPNIKPFEEPQFILNSSIIKKGINKVFHCITPNEVRQALTGMNMTVMADKIVFTGTNGIKLTEFGLGINADVELKSYLLKHDLVSALRGVLDDDAQVFVRIDSKLAYFKSNHVYLFGSLLWGADYPNYKPMLELQKYMTIKRLSFYDSVHTVIDVLDPEDNSRLSVSFEGNVLKLKNDKIESEQEFDEPFEYDFAFDANGVFMDSLLRDFAGDNLEVHFTEGSNYVVFKSVEYSDHSALISVLKRR